MPPPVTTGSLENMWVMQSCSTKRCVWETSRKLHNIMWLWYKMSKYLQHCIQMIHLLKAIVYSSPTSHPLVILNKFHLILFWNKWLRFYLSLNYLLVRFCEMTRLIRYRYNENWSLCCFMLKKFIKNRYCGEFSHIAHFWISLP